MNAFKYSRGHFFGTLLPGAFFLINLFIIDPSIYRFLPYYEKIEIKDSQVVLIAICFVVSYILGVALRLLTPDYLEKLALLIRIPVFILQIFYYKIRKMNDQLTLSQKISIYKQRYPYPDWFFSYFLPSASEKYKQFYEEILKQDFNKNFSFFRRYFINHCKTFIYDSSEGLSEEVMYNEGLVRFISGIIYSLLFALILMIFHLSQLRELFYTYLLIFIVFLYRLRGIRAKEILSVLDGYMFLRTKNH